MRLKLGGNRKREGKIGGWRILGEERSSLSVNKRWIWFDFFYFFNEGWRVMVPREQKMDVCSTSRLTSQCGISNFTSTCWDLNTYSRGATPRICPKLGSNSSVDSQSEWDLVSSWECKANHTNRSKLKLNQVSFKRKFEIWKPFHIVDQRENENNNLSRQKLLSWSVHCLHFDKLLLRSQWGRSNEIIYD
jgi:hypothetical protein